MKCPYCGWKNPATVSFCRKCGEILVSSPEKSPPSLSAATTPARQNVESMPRAKGRAVWQLTWILLVVLLLAGAGITWWIVSAPQSTAAISQTLQTYCHALQSGDYQQAYDQWTSSTQMSEADFAYVQKNKGKITGCEISNISPGNTSAQAQLTFSYANGSIVVNQVNLVLEQGKWKIKGQSAS